ncbi:MAG TPA: hypothetical protein VFO57_05425 [Burkholderiales bacterium]|nr:hypothetical protein [Burkholderiales bacterium]
MNNIWRFYVDQDRLWRWQRLAADRSLISESRAAYKEYESCLANAKIEGYVFHPSQDKLKSLAH